VKVKYQDSIFLARTQTLSGRESVLAQHGLADAPSGTGPVRLSLVEYDPDRDASGHHGFQVG
jgi:hypothetical protein